MYNDNKTLIEKADKGYFGLIASMHVSVLENIIKQRCLILFGLLQGSRQTP